MNVQREREHATITGRIKKHEKEQKIRHETKQKAAMRKSYRHHVNSTKKTQILPSLPSKSNVVIIPQYIPCKSTLNATNIRRFPCETSASSCNFFPHKHHAQISQNVSQKHYTKTQRFYNNKAQDRN